jgi:hypothetical protein
LYAHRWLTLMVGVLISTVTALLFNKTGQNATRIVT